jgi:hypothetical protein
MECHMECHGVGRPYGVPYGRLDDVPYEGSDEVHTHSK